VSLIVPDPATPTECLKMGLCPGCWGTGRVERVVPYTDIFPCSTCDGTGTWPPSSTQFDGRLC